MENTPTQNKRNGYGIKLGRFLRLHLGQIPYIILYPISAVIQFLGRKGGGSSVLTKPEKGDDIPENDEMDEQNPRGRAAPAPATISHKEG